MRENLRATAPAPYSAVSAERWIHAGAVQHGLLAVEVAVAEHREHRVYRWTSVPFFGQDRLPFWVFGSVHGFHALKR
jgi:hypothetical protein